MRKYVIGMDIGATKSHLVLFDTDGNFIDLGRWGGLNHEGLEGSFDQFDEELGQFVTRTLSKHGITVKQIAYCALGVAGVDTNRQHGIVSQIIRKQGFEHFSLANDAYLGVYAGSKTGAGICANNGTGCTLAGINKEGKILQIGGVGVLSADMGGGGVMGERLLIAVYRELFRKGEPTIMTSMLFEELGITSKYDYVETMQEKISNGTFNIHKSGRIIFEAVRQNDNAASGILREIAANYADGITCMIEELSFPPDEELIVALTGSVFVKGEHPLLVDSLKEKVSVDNPARRITYNLLNVPSVAGAALWALNSHNSKGDYYDKVCAQMGSV